MERLFTNITNEELTQNNNNLHTGCYAGERENFMRENLFMTETTMVPVKIALDHGWSSIKGEHIFMETSVVPVDYTRVKNVKKPPASKPGYVTYSTNYTAYVARDEKLCARLRVK